MKRVGFFGPGRAFWIARNTWREAIRQRLVATLLLLASALVVAAQGLGEFNFGATELKFLADFGFGALTFFGSLLAIVLSAQLFFAELENRTALTLLAKPVRRSEFLVGKFVGVWAVLLLFCLFVGATLAAVLHLRTGALAEAAGDDSLRGVAVDLGSVAWYLALQWVKFGVLSAATILIGTFGRTNLFTIVMALLVLAICHLQYLAQDAWQRAGSPGLKIGAGALALLFPNFQVFNVGDHVAGGGVLPFTWITRIGTYGGVYIVVLLVLAVFSFRRREV